MPERLWSNHELRTFLIAFRSGGIFDRGRDVDDADRELFRRQAMHRIVPEVERRALAEIGAVVDPDGVAAVAVEVVEDAAWDDRHTWLMVTEDPWGYLAELVAREIRSAYRAAVRDRRDDKALKGIAAASSRKELGEG